jgi:hypothetical protein
MEMLMKILLMVAGGLTALIFLIWLGLQFKPAPFSPYPEKTPALNTVPLPAGLPGPVERYYRIIYGDRIPIIDTAVIKGRAVISPFGVKFPARFIFVHNAGRDYRHYIETTIYGLPFMRVNESYVDGNSHFELPIGTFDNDPGITQGAVLGLWAEANWFPSIWITDSRVRWASVDDHTALLYVPFGGTQENFVVRFDPASGLLDTMEAMRYRDPGAQARKILWITKNVNDQFLEGTKISAVGSATWFDQGKPWAVFTMEEVKYNVDVSAYIRQKGP